VAKVLVVDDELAVLEMLGNIIEDLGYEPLYAANGAEAWDTLINLFELPALVITDRMMPMMNGAELIHRMRNSHRLRHVPVIMMSAAGDAGTGHLANCFISKPFNLRVLEDAIKGFLQSRGQHQTSRSGDDDDKHEHIS
jgi:two-component system, sensor histidine kinase and response regulator